MDKNMTKGNQKDILDLDLTAVPMQEFSELPEPESAAVLDQLKKATPARIGIGHVGPRYHTAAALRFQADQYAAADAVMAEVPEEVIQKLGFFEVRTKCKDKYDMLTRPDLGRSFDEEAKRTIAERCLHNPDVEIYVGDGLCSPAVEANVPDLYFAIRASLEYDGISVGTPFFVRYCRMNTAKTVAELLHPKVTCILLGERPGLLTAKSMSAYMAYNAGYHMRESDFEKVHIRDTVKVLILLSISFLLVVAEDHMTTAITFSALIAVMFLGVGLQKYREVAAKRIAVKCGKMWVAAEVFLFVLVGATVNIGYLSHVGLKAVVLICGAVIFRMAGVFVCLLGTDMNGKEKLFTMMAYTPKATVQAAIGSVPMAMGLSCGQIVLSVAVLGILITAPLGAIGMDCSYKKLLSREIDKSQIFSS